MFGNIKKGCIFDFVKTIINNKKLKIMKKITNRRELELAIDKAPVSIENVSVKLEKFVKMWIGYNVIKLENGFLIKNF